MNEDNDKRFVPALPHDNEIPDSKAISSNDSAIIYQGVADSPMNEADNLKNAKLRAKDLAVENVQQKIADYVYSFFKDRYITLPDDEIFAITKEIYSITDVKYDFNSSDDDNLIIHATVNVKFDDKDIMNYYIKFFEERNELKLQNEDLRKEIEDLKRQIAEPTLQIMTKDKVALFCQKYLEGYRLYLEENDYEGAIKLYNEAIELNPNFIEAYNNRGDAYYCLEQSELAIQDFSKAIELNYLSAYYLRGECYQALGDEAKAQADFAKYEELQK